MMEKLPIKTIIILFSVLLPLCLASGQETPISGLMPSPYCGQGWRMEGNIHVFNQENLYKHINGEAELYLPYGFEYVATAIYVKEDHKDHELTINIFKMGSLLDAFGIYSNYRPSDIKKVNLGVEGFMDESQLMFYKGRYFIQVFNSGKAQAELKHIHACGSAVDKNIIGETKPPKELAFIQIPGIIPGSERYYVKGLFGNVFFQKGIVAHISAKGAEGQVFIVIDESPQAATQNAQRYAKHLEASGIDYYSRKEPDGIIFKIKDPVQKAMFIRQKGRYLIGTSKIEDEAHARSLISMITSRIP